MKQKTNKGITLIALVITIIVMLILVAVTISMAVNGGLFSYAGKAAQDTNSAYTSEQHLGSGAVTVDGKNYANIDDYLEGKEEIPEPETFEFWIDDTKYEAEVGMTWGGWVASDSYNVDGFKIITTDDGDKIIATSGSDEGFRSWCFLCRGSVSCSLITRLFRDVLTSAVMREVTMIHSFKGRLWRSLYVGYWLIQLWFCWTTL